MTESMNTATEASPVHCTPTNGSAKDVVIDCDISELYYGTFKAVRDTKIPIQKNSIRHSLAPRAAARAPCSAA